MPTRFIQRRADLAPDDYSRPQANAIFIDSDDDQLKFTTGTSGTTTVDVVTETQTQTLTNKTFTSAVLTTPEINDTSADHQYVFAVNELTADRTVTLPLLTGNDTFVFASFTQTLTNKTLTSPTINDGEVGTFGTFHGSATGSGLALTSSVTTGLGVYADDNAAALTSATLAKALRGRLMLGYQGTQESENAGVLGQLVLLTGLTINHNNAGVFGSIEVQGSGSVTTAGTSSDNIHAGVLGRVGLGSTGTLTINSNSVVAGVAAFSNVNSSGTLTNNGILAGFYVGAWASATSFPYGLYVGESRLAAYLNHDAGAITGEEHGVDIVSTGTLSSGDSLVGLNTAVTTAGTAGTWVAGSYTKVTQGATKNVNGYYTAAEFETVNSAANVSDNFVITLNSQNNGANRGSHESYIALRDYGTTLANSFLWLGDAAIGTNDGTVLISSTAAKTHSHSLRIIVGSTAYWLMLTSTAPAA